jgi:hypothetical protein
VEFNGAVVLSLESAPRGRGNTVMEGEVESARLRTRRWRSARRQPDGRAAVARAGGGRRSGSLTGWAPLSVRGRRWADWAGKGGRRWAAAGLEKEGGGWAKSLARAEIQKSKRKFPWLTPYLQAKHDVKITSILPKSRVTRILHEKV